VLRSWEKEFPGIGVQKSQDGARLYRQSDVDQVARIKQLVLGEGLTLAGARRRLEETSPVPASRRDEMAEVLDTLGAGARARIAAVRNGLRSILDVLSKAPGSVGLTQIDGRANGAGGESAPRQRRSGSSGPSKRRIAKTSTAATRRVAGKRAPASRKVARRAKRKRAAG
jgi:DNA-binding transcriptional MerR regulator